MSRRGQVWPAVASPSGRHAETLRRLPNMDLDERPAKQPPKKQPKPERGDVLAYVAEFHRGEAAPRAPHAEKASLYRRGADEKLHATQDKKLNRKLKRARAKTHDAAYRAAQSELLLADEPGFLEPETEMEKTYKVTQKDIVDSVDLETGNKVRF